jgi:hypothetical protein
VSYLAALLLVNGVQGTWIDPPCSMFKIGGISYVYAIPIQLFTAEAFPFFALPERVVALRA